MIPDLTLANRSTAADVLDSLDDRQWEAPTLCAGWTVHLLAAHMAHLTVISFGRFFVTSVRYRGDADRTVDHFARQMARRPRQELTTLLRTDPGRRRLSPPVVGPMGPFSDSCIHLRDLARPLGLPADVPVEHWLTVLDYLVSPKVAPGLVPPGRLDGLQLVATDGPGSPRGDGLVVRGPAEALGMAAAGRPAALTDLDGPGLPVLAGRLQGE